MLGRKEARVIVSHQHKFIFIKTHKVAGTSIEIALTRFAGEDGIVTPFMSKADEDERLKAGFGGPRNFDTTTGLFKNHMTAAKVRTLLGSAMFAGYFKFSVERNSYDKAVSMYAWKNPERRGQRAHSFEDFIACGGLKPALDFDRYSLDGKPAMDVMVMYHDLQNGLDGVAGRLNLPSRIDISGIRRKSGFRDSTGYRACYTDNTRETVATLFAREIAAFGFEF
jgi:hypothetical protein